ncbi:hypothetical protein EZV62_004014 [Acer yangbiense]|uniref:Bulb-type lectin domain-containing protein n=1 Tax=Acer yangbiense TaxID=1000413 RepID=A0A5C7IJ38_9ROSI|nr:hypothetical protein EZV62_004014 [Acer yangbiense]
MFIKLSIKEKTQGGELVAVTNVAIGRALVIPLLCYLCYLVWRKTKAIAYRKLLRELGDNFSFPTTNNKDHSTNHDLKIINFQTIAAASDNLSSAYKLAEGGFGPIYKRDKLLQGEELKDGDELVSTFGVWYNKPDDRTSLPSPFYKTPYRKVVWVANRNSPIIGKSGSLRIDSTDGNLKIIQSGGNPIAITSVEGARNTSVTLEDSGNLVLHELHSNGSIKRMLWQSFDYPTHTLLPGMKLGINLQTGHQWFLRSWLTDESPVEGSYNFGMDPNWTDRYISNEQEKYLTYSVKDDVTSFPTLQIDQNGYLKDYSGFSMSCSEEGGYCGPYRNRVSCNRGRSYFDVKFGLMSSVDGTKFRENDNMTLDDCQLKCYKNCSCVAFAATNTENYTGCKIWSGGTKFIKSYTDNCRDIYYEVEPKGKSLLQYWS